MFSKLVMSLIQRACLLLVIPVLLAADSSFAAERKVDFNRDIRPILSDKCFACHGPDDNKREAGLRLHTQDGIVAKLESGASAVVPGKPAESSLVARITSTNPDELMPPPSTGKKLTPGQIDLLRRWVEQGAPFRGHWSFIPPTKPALPAVTQSAWAINPIDFFVLERLEREGLQPSLPADKTTLIRRVSLDLTGLPPTLAEIDAFLADESPDAYERLIDRLLKSPRFGEHMTRFWLDLVRYGDTHGLHFDNERAMWKYREWVIRAFNDNLPFDQFAIEQVAGDLLPDATVQQKIATGFCRCNVTTSEGGSIDEEVLVRYAVDRTESIGTVFLGLTLGCAVCHDHKFDPISQKEFYQLYAFFNAAADAAMDGNQLAPPPILKVPAPEQTQQLTTFDEKLAGVRKRISEQLATIQYAEPPAVATAASGEPKEFVWIDDATPSSAKQQGNTPWEFVSKPDHPVFSGEKASRRQAKGLSQHFFDSAAPGLKIGEGDKLFAYVYLDPKDPPKEIMLQFNDGSWEHRAYWGEDVIPWGSTGSPSRLAIGPLPKSGEWVRLEVDAAKVGLPSGATLNGWAFTQHDGTCYWDQAGVVTRTPQEGQSFESLLAWEAYDKAQTKSSVPQNVRDAIKVDADKRTDDQKKQIRDYFVENVCGKTKPVFDPLHQEIESLTKQRNDLDAAIPVTLVMADLPTPRDTHVLIRGAYNKKGDKVSAGIPSVFPPVPNGSAMNRLALAKWLVAPNQPLTARVTVNRFWQQLFGRGIVKTAEDFGSQGEVPTHPELLDWLAVEFESDGWNIKHLLKRVLMSNTYRQASRVSPELAQRDPENVLLARGPRFRLDAETVRDSALFVSDLLAEQIGGRSVRPYQPAGIWEAVGFVGSNTREYKADDGRGLYRRSMYTFWKRTAPPPSLMAFDAPSRETCTARRARTNTPLQALALMNDEQYVEAARCLAERVFAEGGNSIPDRLGFAFRTATGRRPDETELNVLGKVLQEQLTYFQANSEAANKLLSVGAAPRKSGLNPSEHAAWTMMANLVLNLDEAITKE